jgi:hypothetical protein
MQLIRIALFVLAVLLLTELSFRVYLYGPASLIPARMDSYTQIHNSGLVQRAADPAINYELKPNLNTWYKGARFRTSSMGLRGDEHTLEKPVGLSRVAVLGSSWTMGSGVEQTDIWHAQLETIINSDAEKAHHEFLNFGVDQYNVGEIVATLEQKTLAYNPDLILIALTYYTPTIFWEDTPSEYEVKPKRHPFFDLHSLKVLDHRLGTGWFNDESSRRTSAPEGHDFRRQLTQAIQRMEDFAINTGIPVIIVRLAYQRSWDKNKNDVIATLIESSGKNLTYINLTDSIRAFGYNPGQLRVSVWDSHPNILGHELIAITLYEELINRNLIPSKLPSINSQFNMAN